MLPQKRHASVLKEFTFFLAIAEQSLFAPLYTVGLSLVYPINVWLWQENIKCGFAFGSRFFFPLSKYVYSHTVFIYRPGPFICFGLVLGLEFLVLSVASEVPVEIPYFEAKNLVWTFAVLASREFLRKDVL